MKRIVTIASAAGMAGAALAAPGLFSAAPPAGVAGAHDWSCRTAAYSSIQAAVEAAPLHGTVVVCRGTYTTTVTVDRMVNLRGQRGAVIDATGQEYGGGVAASWVTVSGLTVENANSTAAGSPADGIITAGFVNAAPKVADHVTITANTVKDNLGSGIDLNSTSYSVASGNKATGNGVGINMADD